jgi:uncharacterized protein YjiS (DUF1127 family)
MTRTMNTCTSKMTGSVPAVGRGAVRGPNQTLFARLSTLLSVWEERRRLASLDERSLQDLGLSAADVERESRRSFFDLPANRC